MTRRTKHGIIVGVDDLLENDPFRLTRSDADLRRLESETRRREMRPYWYLLRALIGVSDRLSERWAAALWREIISHRKKLSAVVGRPVPLRATAIDWLYLRNESERPFRPVVVSHTTLSRVANEVKRDSLTGLPRKAYFEAALARELGASPFVGGSLVFVDLDGFKNANDLHGHAAGDSVLRRFAGAVDAALRTGDLAGRIGGDEFALVLRGVTPLRARHIVRRLRTTLERECAREGISFSFGVTALMGGERPAETLARADAAMYRQKRQRKRTLTRSKSLTLTGRRHSASSVAPSASRVE